MPDRLSLSLWLRGFSERNMLSRFEQALYVFPFSKLRPGISALRIYAIEWVEPPVLEHHFPSETTPDAVLELCREFENPDCSYMVEGWWELWRWTEEGGWQLAPSRVGLSCFGPAFDNAEGDHLRVEFGSESDFLPRPGAPDATRRAQSNLASLVRLARDLETALPVERRALWSESGENLAELADELLADEEL